MPHGSCGRSAALSLYLPAHVRARTHPHTPWLHPSAPCPGPTEHCPEAKPESAPPAQPGHLGASTRPRAASGAEGSRARASVRGGWLHGWERDSGRLSVPQCAPGAGLVSKGGGFSPRPRPRGQAPSSAHRSESSSPHEPGAPSGCHGSDLMQGGPAEPRAPRHPCLPQDVGDRPRKERLEGPGAPRKTPRDLPRVREGGVLSAAGWSLTCTLHSW